VSETDRDVVTRIVDSLFVNGQGDVAERLVLTSKHGRDLGGWCRGAIVDRILDGLSAFLGVPQPTPSADRERAAFMAGYAAGGNDECTAWNNAGPGIGADEAYTAWLATQPQEPNNGS
jgi:hypothetical protein